MKDLKTTMRSPSSRISVLLYILKVSIFIFILFLFSLLRLRREEESEREEGIIKLLN